MNYCIGMIKKITNWIFDDFCTLELECPLLLAQDQQGQEEM